MVEQIRGDPMNSIEVIDNLDTPTVASGSERQAFTGDFENILPGASSCDGGNNGYDGGRKNLGGKVIPID